MYLVVGATAAPLSQIAIYYIQLLIHFHYIDGVYICVGVCICEGVRCTLYVWVFVCVCEGMYRYICMKVGICMHMYMLSRCSSTKWGC